jgi:hypothetical protein
VAVFSSAFVLGWRGSRLPTDYVSMAKVSCRARGHDPVRGMSERLAGLPRRGKQRPPGQLAGLGAGLAGLRRRRIRNPGSLLSFS